MLKVRTLGKWMPWKRLASQALALDGQFRRALRLLRLASDVFSFNELTIHAVADAVELREMKELEIELASKYQKCP